MTPKEKALELYDLMEVDVNDYISRHPTYSDRQARECAINAVNQIILALTKYGESSDELQNMDREFAWWYKVIDELNQM